MLSFLVQRNWTKCQLWPRSTKIDLSRPNFYSKPTPQDKTEALVRILITVADVFDKKTPLLRGKIFQECERRRHVLTTVRWENTSRSTFIERLSIGKPNVKAISVATLTVNLSIRPYFRNKKTFQSFKQNHSNEHFWLISKYLYMWS